MGSVIESNLLVEERIIVVVLGWNESDIPFKSSQDPLPVFCGIDIDHGFSCSCKLIIRVLPNFFVESDFSILRSSSKRSISTGTDSGELRIPCVLFHVYYTVLDSWVDFVYGIFADSFKSVVVASFSQFELWADHDNPFFGARFLNNRKCTNYWISFPLWRS